MGESANGLAEEEASRVPNRIGTQYHFLDWHRFPATQEDEATVERLRRHRLTGRPWRDEASLRRLERRLGRALVPGIPALALPPWMVAYLIVAIPLVSVLKRPLRIY